MIYTSAFNYKPHSRICRAQKVIGHSNAAVLTEGEIQGFTFKNDKNSDSHILLDMGAGSVGGYTVFDVAEYSGEGKLTVTFSDRLEVLIDEEQRDIGDFKRGSCKYLGVEVPVMPANPGRVEKYTVCRTGKYIAPLIQGQQRFILIQFSGEKASVTLNDFYVYYTSDLSEYVGSFNCSNQKIEKLWYVSANTHQIATIDSAAWDSVEGSLLLRSLSKGKDAALCEMMPHLTDYTIECDFYIHYNPYLVSGIGFYFRAKDRDNGYIVNIDLDGVITFWLKKSGKNILLDRRVLGAQLCDSKIYRARLDISGSDFTLTLDNEQAAKFTDAAYGKGSFGFCQSGEKWAVVNSLTVSDSRGEVYRLKKDLSGNFDLSDFQFERVPFFVSDGAKRDRLPWTGDTDWQFRSGYYAFGDSNDAMLNTLHIFERNRTPQGFVHATCYPENADVPQAKQYGNYQSDMFSGWYVITLHTYLLYTGDIKGVKQLYGSAYDALQYFLQYIEGDDLYNQRYETSKGLWDHDLGDTGKNGYTNSLVCQSFKSGAYIAQVLGLTEDARFFTDIANRIYSAMVKYLFCEKEGGFLKSLTLREYCDKTNPFVMGKEMVTAEQAAVIANSGGRAFGYGKIMSLMINGLYHYGYQEQAYQMLVSAHPFENSYVDWLGVVDATHFPQTLSECMHYPPLDFGKNNHWGDFSHPDSGVCDILSGRILGIMPLKLGFSEVKISPNLYGFDFVRGDLHTEWGYISAEAVKSGGNVTLNITAPQSVKVRVNYTGSEKLITNITVVADK